MTGTLLAFNPIFTQDFQKNILQHIEMKYPPRGPVKQQDVELKAVLNTAFNTRPNSVIWYIAFPGMERGIKNHYLVLVHGIGAFRQYISEYLIISAETAELKEVIQLPAFMQLALIATPFHSANYGGILLKIIWTIFSLATLSFAFLGIIISYNRKRLAYENKK